MTQTPETILYNRVTHTGWQAVNGEMDQDTGSGGHHFCLDKIENGNPTTEFLGVKASKFRGSAEGYTIPDAKAIGNLDERAPITFKDWGGDREQWIIADQFSNRHPGLSTANGMPEYKDKRLWDGKGFEPTNFQNNLVIFIAQFANGEHGVGYHIGRDLPARWPRAALTYSRSTNPPHRIGYIEM